MRYGIGWIAVVASVVACGFAVLSTANATSVARLSFEELTDQSELVVSGQISRSWADWDAEHKYIWTHYELGVSSTLKGSPGSTVVVSEPGGTVGLLGQTIAGTVSYSSGETVLLFLKRMRNGYWRTTGWSQGKFAIDKAGMVHPQAPGGGLEIVDSKGRVTATPLRALDGMSVAHLRALVAVRNQGRAK